MGLDTRPGVAAMSWPRDVRAGVEGVPEGDVIPLVVAGEPPFERGTAFEPSLVPHLARLCRHDGMREVLEAAHVFELPPFGWPQVRESTIDTLARRLTERELETSALGALDPLELAVRSSLLRSEPSSPELWARIESCDDPGLRLDLTARLVAARPDPARTDSVVAGSDWGAPSAEGLRSQITVLRRDADAGWSQLEELIDPHRPALLAHLLPVLPADGRRAELVRDLVDLATTAPAWLATLFIIRLQPYAPGDTHWHLERLDDPEEVWRPFIEHQLAAGIPGLSFHEQLLAAHPFGSTLAAIDGPHETVTDLCYEAIHHWGGYEEAMIGPDNGGADDRRLGIDFFHRDQRLERAVIADEEVVLRVSIGRGATADIPIDVEFPPGADTVDLPIRVAIGDQVDDERVMTIDRDPELEAAVRFPLRLSGQTVTGLVIVYNEDRSAVVQAGRFTADLLTGLEEEVVANSSITFSVVDALSLTAGARPSGATIVSDDRTMVASAPDRNLEATVGATVELVGRRAQALTTAAGNHLAADSPIDGTIRALARAGVGFREALGISPLEEHGPIQVVSFYDQTVLPIEWVYGGPPPDDDAKPCTDWPKADPGATECPRCAGSDEQRQRGFVCPSRFWGLGKVIEHHKVASPLATDFVARVQSSDDEATVRVRGPVLLAVSDKVVTALAAGSTTSDPQELLAPLLETAAGLGPVELVPDWSAWQDRVEATGPAILVAMPHQGVDQALGDPALELGGLYESFFAESHVRRAHDEPGPIVLLIGCDTGVEHQLLESFASTFRRWAPAVVATVGEILAEEAHIVVGALLDALRASADTAGLTIGDVVRQARWLLVGQSRVAGLQLVLHGDATWPMGGR